MKQLHRMMIRAYVGPLVVTFGIVLFILTMQFLWKYVDDMMGKGLALHVVAELLFYATASFVPLAIPLAVLLSSIMTMGGLGERSELVPLRSAGMGLFSILRPLMFMAFAIAAFSFYFSNNLLPIANLRFHSLLWDVTEKKPAMNIKPGIFNTTIDGFRIRVREKDEETGLLHDVLIYDHRDAFQANKTVIRASTGRMQRSTSGRYLVLHLYDGHLYDEHAPAGGKQQKGAMLRGRFEEDILRIDLSGMDMRRTDQDLFKDHYKMLTLGQLQQAEDSLMRQQGERLAGRRQHLRNSLFLTRDSVLARDDATRMPRAVEGTGTVVVDQAGAYDLAMNMVRNQISYLERSIEEMRGRDEHLSRFRVEWHRKLMLAGACIIFFFIGAPLGAIIRKGGMGLPTVFAIVFFLVFHIISFSTEKLVVAGKLQPWPGMWISSLVLLPMGIFLTWKAATDSPLLDRDAYHRGWERLRARFRPKHADPPTVQ